MSEELKNYKITEEEYKKILRARERLAAKQKKETQEIVQGFTFDFYGWDRETSSFVIKVEKTQAVTDINNPMKENRWCQFFANNDYGGTFIPLDLWKKASCEETKRRYYSIGLFVPEAELTDETLKYILEEFKNFQNIVIPQSIEKAQKDIESHQRCINDIKKFIKAKQKQLKDKSIDTIIHYAEVNDSSVYSNTDIYSKIKSKNFIKTIKGGK